MLVNGKLGWSLLCIVSCDSKLSVYPLLPSSCVVGHILDQYTLRIWNSSRSLRHVNVQSLCRRLNHDHVETEILQHVRHYFTGIAGALPHCGCFMAITFWAGSIWKVKVSSCFSHCSWSSCLCRCWNTLQAVTMCTKLLYTQTCSLLHLWAYLVGTCP